jgi:ATP-dependent Lon protease
MPKANEKDVKDVPQEVRDKMAFTFAATMDEVLRLALLPLADTHPADAMPLRASRAPVANDGPVVPAADTW